MTELFQKYEETKSKEDRDEIINGNLRLVVYIANKYVGKSSLGLPDLIQEGNKGLMRAVDKFQYRLGYKFSTFAGQLIHQRINRAIKEQGHTVRLPEKKLIDRDKMRNATRALRREMERDPSPEEIAQKMNIPLEKVEQLQGLPASFSLETPVSSAKNGDIRLEDLLAETMSSPDDTVVALTQSRHIRSFLSTILTSDENEILRMYYGLEGDIYSFEEISERFPFSGETVRVKMNKALEKLRNHPQAEFLRDYL